jgi:hypothetical protein
MKATLNASESSEAAGESVPQAVKIDEALNNNATKTNKLRFITNSPP